MSNQDHEFYIGWQEEAPDSFTLKNKRFIGLMILVVPFVAGLLVLSQRGFIASSFEFGNLTEVEGILITDPIPMLKVRKGVNTSGNSIFESVLLVGFGKMGANKDLEIITKQEKKSLSGKSVKIARYFDLLRWKSCLGTYRI